MVTAEKFFKLLRLDDTERNKMINKMSEEDCKLLLEILFKELKDFYK